MARTVLVADDSPTIQNRAQTILRAEGFVVETVSNGVAAIKKLPKVQPDVVLADISMPGKDGFEVCDFIKNSPEFQRVAVLLIASDMEPYDELHAKKVRADGKVMKPFNPQQLVSIVARFADLARSTAPPPQTERASMPGISPDRASAVATPESPARVPEEGAGKITEERAAIGEPASETPSAGPLEAATAPAGHDPSLDDTAFFVYTPPAVEEAAGGEKPRPESDEPAIAPSAETPPEPQAATDLTPEPAPREIESTSEVAPRAAGPMDAEPALVAPLEPAAAPATPEFQTESEIAALPAASVPQQAEVAPEETSPEPSGTETVEAEEPAEPPEAAAIESAVAESSEPALSVDSSELTREPDVAAAPVVESVVEAIGDSAPQASGPAPVEESVAESPEAAAHSPSEDLSRPEEVVPQPSAQEATEHIVAESPGEPTPDLAERIPVAEAASATLDPVPESAATPSPPTAPPLNVELLFSIVHRAVERMSPPALPPEAIEEITKKLCEEIRAELDLGPTP